MPDHKKDKFHPKKIAHMFLAYTADSIKGYVRGLFPRTMIYHHTNIESRKMITISRRWLGTDIKEEELYELNEFNPETARFYKRNLPRIQKGIYKYEEEYGEIIVDKTENNRI